MEKINPIFYDFFNFLRNDLKIELDIVQYENFLLLFASFVWNPKSNGKDEELNKEKLKAKLLNLCKTLWLPKVKYKASFEEAFEVSFNNLLERYFNQNHLNEISKSKEPEPIRAPEPIDAEGTPKESPKNIVKDDKVDSPTSKTEKEFQDIFINYEKGERFQIGDNDILEYESITEVPFIFSSESHFPIPTRKLIQLLKKAKNHKNRRLSDDIDIQKTINNVILEGIIGKIEYKFDEKVDRHFLIFFDEEGPMVPYKGWSGQLKESIQKTSNKGYIKTFYFSNYPLVQERNEQKDFLLFTSDDLIKSKKLSQILKEIKKDTSIVIFSDGGALDNRQNVEKLNVLIAFLEKLNKKTNNILWINPTPKKNWKNKITVYLSYKVKMVSYNFEGVENGIKAIIG
jgi:hypothetical protein